jgi:SAM-dependent methyltransferase
MSSMNTIETFYDNLAPYYKWLYPDWEVSVSKQASQLDVVIREFCKVQPQRILDAACGIGTQVIGLARLGYQLTASDISTTELELARREAVRQSLSIDFCVADMRELWAAHQKQFDVVIACDNAIPHLLSDADIRLAFEQFHHCLVTAGTAIISVRDYAEMDLGGRQFFPRLIHQTPEGRMILFDVWEFEGKYYDLSMYVAEDTGQALAQTHVIRGGRYFCINTDKLEQLFRQAGFVEVQTLRERFYQPLVVAQKG